jgi:hypothetical protein
MKVEKMRIVEGACWKVDDAKAALEVGRRTELLEPRLRQGVGTIG